MKFTGERFVPGVSPHYIEVDHISRYSFASKMALGKSVLDIACGEGYGSRLLRDGGAVAVTGVDISADSIAHAIEHYSDSGITFEVGDAETYRKGQFDLIVSFETVEHLRERVSYLRNLHEMLAPDGILLISTPNKHITSALRPANCPGNKWHTIEYTERTFLAELAGAGFVIKERLGQHLYPAYYDIELVSWVLQHLIARPQTEPDVVSYVGAVPRYFVFVAQRSA